MTDDEIIKSLKCCSYDDTGGCRQCACRINTAACIPILMREAISLILRQKAEIEMFEDEQTFKSAKWVKEFTKRKLMNNYEL